MEGATAMKSTPRMQESRRWHVRAVVMIVSIVLIGVGVRLSWRYLFSNSSISAFPIGWPTVIGGALFVVMLLAILLHSMHEERVTGRTVADALHGRDPLTDEELGRRFYEPDLAPIASRLRRLLAEHLDCDLSGMIASDDFEKWLSLFSGPDSAADSFFEELAIEFQLTRECPWPERFESFDALVRFVAEHERAPKTR